MSDIRSTTLTTQGLNLLAKCQTGLELKFTRVAMGDGRLGDGAVIKDFTKMIAPKLNLPIKSIEITGVGTTVMETELKNDDLKAGFFAREVGIFAQDPDTKNEVLYAYRNTGDDSEYVPAGGASEVWNLIYDVVTVVDQAENVTAVINGDVAYITRVDFYAHRDSVTPHPNAPSLKTTIQQPDTPDFFWAQKNHDNHLHPISIDDTRTAILGDSATTLPIMRGRIAQIEDEMSNIMLKMLAENECPDSNLLIAEDFKDPDQVDVFQVPVTAVTAGSNTIGVEHLDGFYKGGQYWLTDGVRQELIQVKSCIKTADGIYRIMTKENIVNTYTVANTMIYRSTVGIADGKAYGSSDRKGLTWKSSTVWSGQSASVQATVSLESTLDKADNFALAGDTKFDEAGYMTLDTSIAHNHAIGVALVQEGGGNGTWAVIDEKGDNA
nr:MAG TPA: tail collar fiber protein [Caudoviricetes sp.]